MKRTLGILLVLLLGVLLGHWLANHPVEPATAVVAAEAKATGTKVEWEGWSFQWSTCVSVKAWSSPTWTFAAARCSNTPVSPSCSPPTIKARRGRRTSTRGYRLLAPSCPASIAPRVNGASCSIVPARKRAKGVTPQVMLHEEKTGPNYLGNFGRVPGKTLVLWTAGHFSGPPDGYTFIVRWKFRDDGTLIPEVGATGVPQHTKTGDTSTTGAFIGFNAKKEKVFAPSHMHHFLYRLDFDVDGEENVVEEFNWERNTDDKTAGKAQCTWTPILKETGPAAQSGDVSLVARRQLRIEATPWAIHARTS